jgi:hypothetical protein
MFAKKYGILVAVEAILIKLCFNLFVVVKFWPVLHNYVRVFLVMYFIRSPKLLFLQFWGVTWHIDSPTSKQIICLSMSIYHK